jgi:hypothetical protein
MGSKMSKTYTKISETEVKITITSEISSESIYTEVMLNQAITDVDAEITRLNAKKLELQAELVEIQNTLNS